MFAVINPMWREPMQETIVVADPERVWKNSDELKAFVHGFGKSKMIHVERSGIGRGRSYTVTASPLIPMAARRALLEEQPLVGRKRSRRGRHRVDGPISKSDQSPDLIETVALAQGAANQMTLQR